eukprot:CAMPEP_0119564118 /NCGR_PEP_ID=MMETSP1352-20130426/25890_1 /TAXON_ID=265584 /ORGANISM="Stauroneis constricta, Strain CCMP1120" /LENGTH=153 /DNA_ID=CAMNT_0007612831 /DNA_START=37 /DNA_END=498 /DNA_ORIENTATION=+
MRIATVVFFLTLLTCVAAFMPDSARRGSPHRVATKDVPADSLKMVVLQGEHSKPYMEKLKSNAMMAQKAADAANGKTPSNGSAADANTEPAKKYSDAYLNKLEANAELAVEAAAASNQSMQAASDAQKEAKTNIVSRIGRVFGKVMIPWLGMA